MTTLMVEETQDISYTGIRIPTKLKNNALFRSFQDIVAMYSLPSYGEIDPSPFVAYAHGEQRCWGIVPFIWAHVPESADKEGWTGLSIRSAADQERYRAAGLATLQHQPAQAGFTSGRG